MVANVASTTDVPQLADDHGQTYTNHVAASSYDADGDSMTISLALDVSPGTTTVTASLPLAVDTFEVYVLEYAGITAFDASSYGIGATDTGPDGMTSGAVTTTGDSELLLGAGFAGGVIGGTGFTERSAFDANTIEDRFVPPGSHEATAQCLDFGVGWVLAVAAFR